MMDEEKPGSTRIVSILPEGIEGQERGTSSARSTRPPSRTSCKAQLIRYVQAKSWVEQARAIYEVNRDHLARVPGRHLSRRTCS